jgi:hypothetical protein
MEEPTPQYTSFLRSGSYPILSRKLGQYSELSMRLGSRVALALLAAGAGYMLTQWVVPGRAGLVPMPGFARPETSLATVHVTGQPDDARPNESADTLPSALSGANLGVHAHRSGTQVGIGRDLARNSGSNAPRAKRRSGDMAEVSVGASHDTVPVAGTPTELDMLSAESLRTELIADRVRALDEAHAQADPDDRVMATTFASQRAREDLGARPTGNTAPGFRSSYGPVPLRQLRAGVNIEGLSVRGPLSAANVRHSLERLAPALAACYEQSARQAEHNRFGRVELSMTIDETGHTRGTAVQGAELPGLAACMSGVASKLVSQPPDTGTVHTSVVVNFVP